ncbi:hydantoinase/oxoprolinase family protein [Marinomonas foliarum]|uniref:Hydantoinase/oxoprolinase family protein n=1 Tax=Marinomonas foliarum TaxID=491950 RepID=A0ABX7INT8_9GAMM|nr:hydantoinase/oxoprolinase family protein [Marinomonas foliarum]QRV23388.1 hydantoinase/oxoprolinase family protein [Marinomonas foliarum]|tara:strand:- start:9250 stop:11349 length:2100 start_codon:yes stop_codon:yes gene_type:complete
MIKIGVDVGGTFTDLILEKGNEPDSSNKEVFVHKVSSTPSDQSIGVLKGIKEICNKASVKPSEVDLIVHGTTVATNITLEHNGAEVGMITTKGFRDILHIGRHKRPHNFSLQFDVPWQSTPLVKRRNRISVSERVLPPTGKVEISLNEDEVREAAELLKSRGIKSIVICFLFAFLNDSHEKRAKEIILDVIPDAYVSTSSEVANVMREYERFSTTAMNAYVGPKVALYLKNLESKFSNEGISAKLRIMQSNGGVSTAEACSKEAVTILMSGLAGGIIGGRYSGGLSGVKNILTVDIGGTSADLSTIPNGEIKIMNPRDTYVGEYPVLTPMIDMMTLGAGGGSIAYIDEGGHFRVGPQSAGAEPGPVCYGNGGTQPTVTDAQVVLGRLDPDQFLGGDLKIDYDLAYKAIREKIADPLGINVIEAALGIIRIMNSNMALAIRANSVAKGYDPRDFSLMPFGGAGPLNGVALAKEICAKEVVVPPAPGITAAIGLLATDMRYEFTRSVPTVISTAEQSDFDRINNVIETLKEQCAHRLMSDGVEESKHEYSYIAECRYEGQGFELRAEISNGILNKDSLVEVEENFHKQHEQDYGWRFDEVGVQIVTIRVIGSAKSEPVQWPRLKEAETEQPNQAVMYSRDTIFDDGEKYDTPRYDRNKLLSGHKLQGPAIIMQHNSTTLIPKGYTAEVHSYGNIHISETLT